MITITAGFLRRAVGRWLVGVIAGLVMVISLVFARGTPDPPTTYAASSALAGIAAITAGLSLIAVGVWFTVQRPDGSVGTLAVLTGSVWMVADWSGWRNAPALIRSLAMVVAPFLLPLIIHLHSVFSSLGSRVVARRLVIVAYVVTATISLGQAMLRNPLYDRYCWDNCTTNVFLIHADLDIMRWLRLAALWSTIGIGVLATAAIVARLANDTAVARRGEIAVLVPAMLAVVATFAHAGLLVWEPAEDPRRGSLRRRLSGARSGADRACRGSRTDFGRLRANSTRPRPHRPPAPRRRPTSNASDHPRCHPRRPQPQGRLLATRHAPLRRRRGATRRTNAQPRRNNDRARANGRPIALIVHDRGLRNSHQLTAQIGAATRLAVDNERLRAESLAHIRDLRASRARIIDASDTTRRQLERDLHDGAQHRLLAVAHELRLAAETAGDPTGTALLDSAIDQAQHALAEVRDIAHGIFPAILVDAGLGPAVSTLADPPRSRSKSPPPSIAATRQQSRPPPTRSWHPDQRAANSDATYITIDIVEDQQRLIIDIVDDGTPLDAISSNDGYDRIGALDGHINLIHGRLRAEIRPVVVADDLMLTREGIVHILRDSGIDVVGQAENADELLRQVDELQPDVVVVDIKMPPTHTDEGLVAAQRIRQRHPDMGILVLSRVPRSELRHAPPPRPTGQSRVPPQRPRVRRRRTRRHRTPHP